MKRLTILGSTGSIGTQTLDIIRNNPERYQAIGLSCKGNIKALSKQIQEFRPKQVHIEDETQIKDLQNNFPSLTILTGKQGLIELACTSETDMLIVAIYGTTALHPTTKAIEAGIPIALASKEVLVSAGSIIMPLAKEKNVPILPIDSEHAALKQCLASIKEDITQIEKATLTASGGPFWKTPKTQFENITPKQALNHPSWTMGPKITIDSATLMNKGLELIEAHHLFNIPFEKLDAIIHPTSIIHALAEFKDGTTIAQMGLPDMRFPISYALSYPEKHPNPWPKTELSKLGKLEFHPIPHDKFPLLGLAITCGKTGGTAPAIMNAANEAAVLEFLKGSIKFTDIQKQIETALEKFPQNNTPTLEELIALDQEIKENIYEH